MLKILMTGPLKWFILAALLLTGLLYWTNWSLDARIQITSLESTVERRDATIAELRESIADNLTENKELDTAFKDIEFTQVDLLCAARYGTYLVPQSEPTIVEVIKYRDRITQCPTEVKADAEPLSELTVEYRPVNEEIALQSLNNSWKAYCAATSNEDKICLPFR